MSKGSKRRVEKYSNIMNNWDEIDWSDPNERRTGDGWCQATGLIIIDPDGWDRTNDSFITEPIGFGEFLKRKASSTSYLSNSATDLNQRYQKDKNNVKCDQCGAKYSWYHIDKLTWNEDKLVCKDWCLNSKKNEDYEKNEQ